MKNRWVGLHALGVLFQPDYSVILWPQGGRGAVSTMHRFNHNKFKVKEVDLNWILGRNPSL